MEWLRHWRPMGHQPPGSPPRPRPWRRPRRGLLTRTLKSQRPAEPGSLHRHMATSMGGAAGQAHEIEVEQVGEATLALALARRCPAGTASTSRSVRNGWLSSPATKAACEPMPMSASPAAMAAPIAGLSRSLEIDVDFLRVDDARNVASIDGRCSDRADVLARMRTLPFRPRRVGAEIAAHCSPPAAARYGHGPAGCGRPRSARRRAGRASATERPASPPCRGCARWPRQGRDAVRSAPRVMLPVCVT